MPTTADELRERLQQRIEEEQLADPRLKTLEAWVLGLPDEAVADAIELVMVGLDASRRGRLAVLRIIDDQFRRSGEPLAHAERVAFLRWVVRSRATDGQMRDTLSELRGADETTREPILERLAASDGDALVSLDNAHPVLAHAWRAAPADARPTAAVHRGEPEPFIGARNTVRLVIFFARRLEHLVPRASKPDFDRLVSLAEKAVIAGRTGPDLGRAIDRAPMDGPVAIARSACVEARNALMRPDMAGGAARPAGVKTVGILLEAEGKNAVRSFLSDVDEELRRLDVVHALDLKKKTPTSPIVRAVHRGAEKGKIVLWLAELASGQLGLLSKQGVRWAWNEGDRDDILATIPDVHFERAVMAARGGAVS